MKSFGGPGGRKDSIGPGWETIWGGTYLMGGRHLKDENIWARKDLIGPGWGKHLGGKDLIGPSQTSSEASVYAASLRLSGITSCFDERLDGGGCGTFVGPGQSDHHRGRRRMPHWMRRWGKTYFGRHMFSK